MKLGYDYYVVNDYISDSDSIPSVPLRKICRLSFFGVLLGALER